MFLIVQVHLLYQVTLVAFSDVTITTISNSQGGGAETDESIKHNAPLQYATQDRRAVTTSDYETLVQTIYPNALSVSAWGEDDETPRYAL